MVNLAEAAFFAAKNGNTEILRRLFDEDIVPEFLVDKVFGYVISSFFLKSTHVPVKLNNRTNALC